MRPASLRATRAAFVAALAALCLCGPAYAVPLLSGTVDFTGPSDDPLNQHPPAHHLNGTIDYSVWAPGTFPYSGIGYTPTAGELVYSYLIHVNPTSGPPPYTQVDPTNASEVSSLSLIVLNDADRIGQSSGLGDVPATEMNLDPSGSHLATWFFGSAIDPGQDSYLLVFSSPNIWQFTPATLFDHGTQTDQPLQLPTPSTERAPEPGTLILLALGALWGVPAAVRRVRRLPHA
jgi:hypothetical protein